MATASRVGKAEQRVAAYSAIANAQSKGGDRVAACKSMEAAAAAAATSRDLLNKPRLYATIAATQWDLGDLAGARKTLRTAGVVASKDRYSRDIDTAACEVAEKQIQMKDVPGARETLKAASTAIARHEKSSEDDRALALRHVAAAQAAAGDVAAAKATAAHTRSMKGWAGEMIQWIYSDIAVAQAAAGDLAGARERLAKSTPRQRHVSTSWGPRRRSIKPSLEQLKTGDIVTAKATAVIIGDAEYKADVYCEIAQAQRKVGDLAGFRESLVAAGRAAPQIALEGNRACLYRRIVGEFVQAGDVAAAIDFADRMIERPSLRCVALTEAAETLFSTP